MRLSLVAALALSCAAGNKHKPEAMPPRVPDGAGDKRAAMRAAAPPELGLEVEHERWNYEAAQEVKDVEAEKKAAASKPAPAPTKAIGFTGQPGAATQPGAPPQPGATPQPPPAAAPAPVK